MYNIRIKNYKEVSQATVVKSFVLGFFSLSFFKLFAGATALILAQILSYFTGNYILIKNVFDLKNIKKYFRKEKIKEGATKYIDFPKYSVPAGLSSTLSTNLNNILISKFFSTAILGQYNIVEKILGAPSMLIGTAVGQVFFQRASREILNTGSIYNSFKNVAILLIFLSLGMFSIAYFIVANWFEFIFGVEWKETGEFALILIPLFFVRFIVVPLTLVNNICETQKFGMIWQAGRLLLTLVIIYTAYNTGKDFGVFLEWYTYSIAAYYFVVGLVLFQFAKGNWLNLFQSQKVINRNKNRNTNKET
jgi:O-antigen/teichoic acid export membrane protein